MGWRTRQRTFSRQRAAVMVEQMARVAPQETVHGGHSEQQQF
jgi:hypothetical protein